jgi:mRNA interferase RelE/StbE
MKYNIFILRRAQKELGDLTTEVYARVRDSIRLLAENPRPPGWIKLANREGWRIRIGEYRVIYKIDDEQKTVTVLAIGHRRDVYR